MRYDDDTFVARYPDGRRLRVKRDNSDWHAEEVAKAERGNREHLAKADRSFYGILAKSDDDSGDVGVTKARDPGRGHHSLASALVQHLHDRLDRRRERHGFHKSAKDDPMTSTSHAEFVQSVVKQYGIVALAKSMVQHEKSYGLDEHTFTQLATEHASRLYPNDRPDSAFSKLYESEESVRRACAIAKAWPMPMSLEPMVATGASGFPSARRRSGSSPGRADDSGDVDSVGVSDAYQQLMRLVAQQRRAGESASAAFERVYLDPANRHLAEAERAQNRPQPTTIFPMPR
jgi:hypothetical protein